VRSSSAAPSSEAFETGGRAKEIECIQKVCLKRLLCVYLAGVPEIVEISLDQTFTVLLVFQNNGFKLMSVTLRVCSKQSPEIRPSERHFVENRLTGRPFEIFECNPIWMTQRDCDLTVTFSQEMTVEFKLKFS
jgi:hypothetical protein